MNLKEFIKANKIKDKFIAVHNKDDHWVIAGLPDDLQLADYMEFEVLESRDVAVNIIAVKTSYDKLMQIRYYKAIEERKALLADSKKEKRKKK